MKTIRQYQRSISLAFVVAFLISCSSNGYAIPTQPSSPQDIGQQLPPPDTDNTSSNIKIALLLDTSGSMNGLLEQAKSQLWKIVNELSMAKKGNQNANLEIALYQYGNDDLNSKEGYIEKILPLTNDLDAISEKLFALSTNGGEEYCGHAIKTATNQLDWETDSQGLNLIFIAGNESFNQGHIDYKESCKSAINKGISINTIFCGDYENGINTNWLSGAQLTEGSYMNIDINQKTVYIETPYDDQINQLNIKLNNTYIAYGELGVHKKEQQNIQDNNSSFYGLANSVSRTISKSSHVYYNGTWDLVDAQKDADFKIEKVDPKTLPLEMQGLTVDQKITYVKNKADERILIQNKISELSKLRKTYMDNNQGSSTNSLDKAMLDAIKKQAKNKGFNFNDKSTAMTIYPKANVDFEYFETVSTEAKNHRASRLINFNTFTNYSKDDNTIILDTRSKRMYNKMHVKGAIHINFSDFTQAYLAEMIPDTNTRILIYCNNNFVQEPLFVETFVTKSYVPPITFNNSLDISSFSSKPVNTLALNIPTYINLYGYHYRNVYELNELVSSTNPLLELEGTDIMK